MYKIAIITDGIVSNIALYAEIPVGGVLANGGKIGDLYADGVFTPVTPPVIIPEAVTMRQARLALLGAGVLDTTDAAIAAMPGIEGDAARIEWEYAHEIRRDSPLVAAMAGMLGLDDAALDALFLQASTL